MDTNVTLERDVRPGYIIRSWMDVSDDVASALTKLSKDADEMGITPNWATTRITMDFDTVSVGTFAGPDINEVGSRNLYVSVQAKKKEEDKDA